MNKSKLAIGSANFGLNYGVSNSNGRLDESEVFKILEYAHQNKIQNLDTAYGYGNAHHVLRQFPEIERFEIITKYSSEQIINRSQNIQHLIDEIPGCSRSVLIHDRYSAVKDAKFIKALELLHASQKVGQIEKFGMSVYSLEELDFALNRFEISLLQIPLNVFDQRFASSIVEKLADANIELCTFLFFARLIDPKADQRNGFFDRWKDLFKSWDEHVKLSQKGAVFCALKFVLSQKFISKIVVGLDTLDQLVELRNIEEEKYNFDETKLKHFATEDEDLILPMNWRLQ